MKSENQIEQKIKKLVKEYLVIYNGISENINNQTCSGIIMNNLFDSITTKLLRDIMTQIKTLSWVSGIKYKSYFPKDVVIYGS